METTVPIISPAMILGSGYDSLTSDVKGQPVRVADPSKGGNELMNAAINTAELDIAIKEQQDFIRKDIINRMKYSSKYVENTKEACDIMDIQGSLAIKQMKGLVNVDLSGGYFSKSVEMETTMTFFVKCQVESFSLSYIEDRLCLDPRLRNLNSEQFVALYGDCFVSGVVHGGLFIARIDVKTSSIEDKKKLAGQLNLTSPVVDGSGKLNLEFKKATSNKQVEVYITTIGGGSNPTPGTVEEALILSKKWQELVEKNPAPMTAIMRQYKQVPSFRSDLKKIAFPAYGPAQAAIQDNVDKFWRLRVLSSQIHEILENPDKYEERDSGEVNSKKWEETKNTIDTHLEAVLNWILSAPAMLVNDKWEKFPTPLFSYYELKNKMPVARRPATPPPIEKVLVSIGECQGPHRCMVQLGEHLNKAGWTERLHFYAWPKKQDGMVPVFVSEAFEPHRAMFSLHHPLNSSGWQHRLHFYAYEKQVPGSVLVSVGEAHDPHRTMVNLERTLDYHGWKERLRFYVQGAAAKQVS